MGWTSMMGSRFRGAMGTAKGGNAGASGAPAASKVAPAASSKKRLAGQLAGMKSVRPAHPAQPANATGRSQYGTSVGKPIQVKGQMQSAGGGGGKMGGFLGRRRG